MYTQRKEGIERSLQRAVEGEVRFSAADRALYAYDASVYRVMPVGVVIPKTLDDVIAGVEICREHDVPIYGRGCGDQLRRALKHPGPAIIECVVDPHEPPMPATVKREQAVHMYQALAEGTPNRKRIALTIVGDVLEESGYEASPGPRLPKPLGAAARRIAETIDAFGSRDAKE